MKDGLYRVHFQTPLGWGSSVAYVAGGKVWGGDGGMYFFGTVEVDGDRVTSHVQTDRHTQFPGITSVFGRDQVRVNLTGRFEGEIARLKGSSPELPEASFTAELKPLRVEA